MNFQSSLNPFSFWKMHGCGNHFIVAALEKSTAALMDERCARALCDPHFGVGADGIMAIQPPSAGWADFDVLMRNPDGSLMGMCGNGMRCVAQFIHELIPDGPADRSFNVEGKKIQTRWSAGGIQVVMDAPSPCTDLEIRISAEKVFRAIILTIPNPHAVIFCETLPDNAELLRIGPMIECHPSFPNRTNVEFVTINTPAAIAVSVWERGAGATLACGTGACAAVVAGISKGYLSERCSVRLPGGVVTVEWKKEGTPVILEGPAVKVFEGEFNYAM